MEKQKILLIDNDPATLDMISHALEGQGYEVTISDDGEAALELIRGKGFDLVLTDLTMTPVGGPEILTKTKEISPKTMVMILCGHDDVDLAGEALRIQADDYLHKPPDPGQLFFRVASCLDKFRLRGEIARSQEALRLFKDVVASSNEPIAVSDPDGRLIYVNPAHEELFGRSLDVSRSSNYRDYYPEKSVQRHKQEIFPAVKRGETWEGVIEAIDSKGRPLSLWQRTYAICDEEGNVYYCFTLMHEFKERKVEKGLRQAQQSQAIGTLAGGIAHEFNNILWIIMANTELAIGNLPDENDAHKNLRRVEKACSRATDLVQQILTFSRQGEYKPRPLDILPIVKESLKFLRTSIPTTIEIRQNISIQSATVMSDPSQVHQTLINLCTNAADAMGEKPGVLEIGVADIELDQDEAAFHHDLAPGKYIKLSVKDTGVGMAPKIMERIFEPFFTTKGVGEGRGLGLAVVHGIVKSCEGAIEVHSEPGKGSSFYLFFPKMEQGIKSAAPAFIPSAKGKERILFVDDDREIASMGKEILEGYGYRVESKTCSRDALEAFRDHPDRFDLIITDMIMPKMTGEELAEALVRIRPDIPIILCTGYDEEIYKARARKIGIKKVMMKPVNGRTLAHAIRSALQDDLAPEDMA